MIEKYLKKNKKKDEIIIGCCKIDKKTEQIN